MKVVIIGGTAGGAGVAARLRRLDENVEITIIEKNSYISWAGCALPYFAGGVIQDRDTLFLATKEMFYQRFRMKHRCSPLQYRRRGRTGFTLQVPVPAESIFQEKI